MMTAPTGGPLSAIASIEAVLRLARHLPVFPCLAHPKETIVNGKPKMIRAKSPHIQEGFLKASQDEDQIRVWWKRWPDALVGVPMGQATGLIAIDYDPDKHTDDTGEWLELNTDALMSARVHGTMRGGRHYLFRVPKGQRYRTGADLFLAGKVRRGIDLRADGGYIIWWPIHGGTQTNDVAPFLPAGLIDERSFARNDAPPTPRQEPSPEAWLRDRQNVEDALAYLDPADRDRWIRIGMALHRATGGNDEGFQLWHGWSAGGITGETPHTYAGIDDCRYHWASFKDRSANPVTLASLFHEAKARGYVSRARQHAAASSPEAPQGDTPTDQALPEDERFAPLESIADDGEPRGRTIKVRKDDPIRRPMRWPELENDKPPERAWRISHWLTTGPTLLAGTGGIGKTLLAQTIATAIALGRPFVDEIEEASVVLFWACEDEHDELWRRQIAICNYFEVPLSALENKLIIEPRIGCDNTLYTMIFGRPGWTPLHDELRAQVGDYRASALFLDNIAQTFGANENDRHHVTSFVNGVIGLAPDQPFSPILMGHPSRNMNSEFSGSSAWENAVRMRWYMGSTLPDKKDEEDAEEADPNIRYLAKRKTNYSVKDYRKLIYRDGVFVPEAQQLGTSFSDRFNFPLRKEGAISAVLHAVRKFNEQEIRVTEGKNSPDFLPRKMREAKLAQDYSQKELVEAMVGLRLQGRLMVTKVGSYGNRTPMTGLSVADVCTK